MNKILDRIKTFFFAVKSVRQLIDNKTKFVIVTDEKLQRAITDFPRVYRHYQELLEKEDVYAWYAGEYDVCNQDRTKLRANIDALSKILIKKRDNATKAALDFFVENEEVNGYYQKGRKDICQDILYIVEDIQKGLNIDGRD